MYGAQELSVIWQFPGDFNVFKVQDKKDTIVC